MTTKPPIPTPIDVSEPLRVGFRAVRRERGEVLSHYVRALAELERSGSVPPLDEVPDEAVGLGAVYAWRAMAVRNLVQRVGEPDPQAFGWFAIPRRDRPAVRRALRSVIWSIRVRNTASLGFDLLLVGLLLGAAFFVVHGLAR